LNFSTSKNSYWSWNSWWNKYWRHKGICSCEKWYFFDLYVSSIFL